MEALISDDRATDARPDLKFEVESVTVNGNQATVKAKWGGTQTVR